MTKSKAAAALLLFALLSPGAPSLRAQQTTTPQPAQAQAQSGQQTQAQASPTPTPDVIERIKDEGLKRSQVMRTLEYLTDVIGPRLTGSPSLKRANNWTRDRLAEWG